MGLEFVRKLDFLLPEDLTQAYNRLCRGSLTTMTVAAEKNMEGKGIRGSTLNSLSSNYRIVDQLVDTDQLNKYVWGCRARAQI